MIKTTLVKTPTGCTPITDLHEGDLVCNEFSKPVKVKQVISNGKSPVVHILVGGQPWVTCSKEQRWLVKDSCGPKQSIIEVKKVSELNSHNRLLTVLDGRPFGYGLSVVINEDGEEETFDIDVESETNLYLLANGLVAHS